MYHGTYSSILEYESYSWNRWSRLGEPRETNGAATTPPGSWTWASFARAHNASSARALTQSSSALRRQEDEDVQRPGELRAVHRRNGRAYQRGFLSRIMPLEAEGTAGLTRRHGRAALRGISRALALQQGYMLAHIAEEVHAPDRAAQGTRVRGRGAIAIIRTWVSKSMTD